MSATRETRDAIAAIFSGRHDRNANPILLGVIGMVVVAVVMVGALALPQLTYLVRTQSYTAEFANAAGLAPNDPVYVSGVPAGRVEGLEMAGDHVLVDFRIDRKQDLGDRTRQADGAHVRRGYVRRSARATWPRPASFNTDGFLTSKNSWPTTRARSRSIAARASRGSRRTSSASRAARLSSMRRRSSRNLCGTDAADTATNITCS